MEVESDEKISKTVAKLISNFGFTDNDWQKEAFNLLLGSLIMNIRNVKEKKFIIELEKRKKNPELYWDIGKIMYDFIERRKIDAKKFGKSFEIIEPYKLIASLIKDAVVVDFKAKWQGFTEKRSFEACYFLYLLDPKKEFVNPNLPWSFYFEFTQQRKLFNLIKKRRKLVYSQIVKKRQEVHFVDKDNRAILKAILDLDENKITKTKIRDVISKYLREKAPNLKTYIKNISEKEIQKEESLFDEKNFSFILKDLKQDVIAFYKRLSYNDISWSDPDSRSHQVGILIPKKAFYEKEFLQFSFDLMSIQKDDFTKGIRKNIKINWLNHTGEQKTLHSRLYYYKSKNECRITICPKEFFFPEKPDYMILLKGMNRQDFILYLGQFNDEYFESIRKIFGLEKDEKMKIIRLKYIKKSFK